MLPAKGQCISCRDPDLHISMACWIAQHNQYQVMPRLMLAGSATAFTVAASAINYVMASRKHWLAGSFVYTQGPAKSITEKCLCVIHSFNMNF